MKKGKRTTLSIIILLASFLAGILFSLNLYLSILFLILGIFCVYYLAKNTPEIVSIPEGFSSPNPKNFPKGSLLVKYKK